MLRKNEKNQKAINAPIDLNVIVCVSGHFLASYFLAINFQFILQIKDWWFIFIKSANFRFITGAMFKKKLKQMTAEGYNRFYTARELIELRKSEGSLTYPGDRLLRLNLF